MKSESGFSLAMARQPFHLDSLTILQWKALPGLKRSTTWGESHDTRVRPLSINHEEKKDSAVYKTHFLLLSKIHGFDIKMSAVISLSF